MNKNMAPTDARSGRTALMVSWVLGGFWLVSTVWASAAAETTGGVAAAGIQFLSLFLFLFVHGSIALGWRGTIAFLLVLALVSFLFEALSVATGFPFGFFEHHAPGPRPLNIPIAVPIGYAVYGWLAWAQTRAMLGGLVAQRQLFVIATPIIGTFLLAGYDYPWDAIGASVLKTHSYRYPSGLFGVPLRNFFGWLLTGWVAFQLFALIERRFPAKPVAATRGYLLIAPLIWCSFGLSYILRFWTAPSGTVSVGGRSLVIADVYEASAAIALPAMVLPAILTIIFVLARPAATEGARNA